MAATQAKPALGGAQGIKKMLQLQTEWVAMNLESQNHPNDMN